MFRLDVNIFKTIYEACETLGHAFEMGAFEGFVMYIGLILMSVELGIESKKKKGR